MFPTPNPKFNLHVYQLEHEQRMARIERDRLTAGAPTVRNRRGMLATMRQRLGDVLMKVGEHLQERPRPAERVQGNR
jgi:hypothetical protein